jgi:hypothetical protein
LSLGVGDDGNASQIVAFALLPDVPVA